MTLALPGVLFSLIFTSPNYFIISSTPSSFDNENDTGIDNIDIEDHINKVSIIQKRTKVFFKNLLLSVLYKHNSSKNLVPSIAQIIGISAEPAADSEDCDDVVNKDGSRLVWAEWRDDPTYVNVS